MKKILSVFTVVCAIAAITTISSCTKTCDPGYEGSDCKTAMNTKFGGLFHISDTAATHYTNPVSDTTYYIPYDLTVTASLSDPTVITLGNFGGYLGSITGKVDGTNFTGDNTTIGGVQISNVSGSINGNVISYTYTGIDSFSTATSHAGGSR